jgi:hypothetical protein
MVNPASNVIVTRSWLEIFQVMVKRTPNASYPADWAVSKNPLQNEGKNFVQNF